MPNCSSGLPLLRLMGSVGGWRLANAFTSNRGYLPADERRTADVGDAGLLMRRLGGTSGAIAAPDVPADSAVGYLDEGNGYPGPGGLCAPALAPVPACQRRGLPALPP